MVVPFENQEVEDEVQYRICETTECPVVYFTEELDQRFQINAIRETPNFKLENDERPYPLCYCFGYGKEHVNEDISENEETNIDCQQEIDPKRGDQPAPERDQAEIRRRYSCHRRR